MSTKHQKIAVIIWVMDPENTRRFLLRHNKPFNGYEDEWTIAFGDVEPGEERQVAAIREAQEEFGVNEYLAIKDLFYAVEYTGKHGLTEDIYSPCNYQISTRRSSLTKKASATTGPPWPQPKN